MKVRNLQSLAALRYLVFCNVLHICNVRTIPTYRLYDCCLCVHSSLLVSENYAIILTLGQLLL